MKKSSKSKGFLFEKFKKNGINSFSQKIILGGGNPTNGTTTLVTVLITDEEEKSEKP